MKKGNKLGQAFLITAVIFIAIISAFITTRNYSKKTELPAFAEIAEEIQTESEKVMDYALVYGDNSAIGDFTEKASDYAKRKGIETYFISGNSGNLNCYNADENSCSVSPDSGKINVQINSETYEFPLMQKGEHFYFVMIKEEKGERYVYANS